MLDKLKQKFGSNWKVGLLVAMALGVGVMLGEGATALGLVDGMVDDDLRAQICAEEMPEVGR